MIPRFNLSLTGSWPPTVRRMPAHVAADGALGFRAAAPRARAGRALAGHRVSARTFEVPGDETGPASEITLFSPESVAAGRGVFYIHGGGMVMGHRLDDADDHIALVEQLQVPVIAVSYRLAPEDPFPAAADDVQRAWLWVVEHATELGVDPSGLILMGASAGGALAAGLALRLRDENVQLPLAVSLIAPMLDDRNDSVSSHDYDGTSIWDRGSNMMGWDAFLGAERTAVSAYAAPARATDLSGLPPTYLEVGSFRGVPR